MALSEWIKEQGRALGFDRVGIAPATDLPELAFFPQWLARGYAGQMDYLRNPRRADVRTLLPEARSVICCALAYDTDHPRSTELPLDPERGWLSRYAWGDDYHQVVREKLEALRIVLAAKVGPGFQSRAYVDTGPVLERVYGKHAGLGWQAKNTCLLDDELGSFFFLGVLLTNLELDLDTPLPDGCGACTLCLEACPTGALVEPYLLDARRCISYLTIELRDSIPEEFRQPLGRHVFGCDICQDVCPYNQRARQTREPAFQPRPIEEPWVGEGLACAEHSRSAPSRSAPSVGSSPRSCHSEPAPGLSAASLPGQTGEESASSPATESLSQPRLDWLARLSEEEFRRLFRGSAVKRAHWRGLLRNTLVAMGNSGNRKFQPLLEKFAASKDSLLAEHARWALNQLKNDESNTHKPTQARRA